MSEAAMTKCAFPSLYQINTRVWLTELGRRIGRTATLDEVPEETLDRIAALGFDWLYLLGVWQTGPAGLKVAQTKEDLLAEYRATLPDLREDDICSSPFAVRSYTVHQDFGGDDALMRLRQRLRRRGLRLMLDFVPNHVALDHPWVDEHPEFFIEGSQDDLAREPNNYGRLPTKNGPRILAYGRDPYFPGWSDTLQLNYRHPGLRGAMVEQLLRVASLGDGARCDMAMLLMPDVFVKTWGERSLPRDGTPPADAPFWPEAIARVSTAHPALRFMAEVYWDLEYSLQGQGFHYTYDKRYYDRVHAGEARPIREHLWADPDFQRKSVRFLENHDEPRAAAAFAPAVYRAATVLTYFVPGLRFFHEGQFEGRRVRVPMQLARRPDEPVDNELRAFYRRLLETLKRPEVRDGQWTLLDCRPAWEGNPTWESFISFVWESIPNRRLLVVVNYGPTQGQCYLGMPFLEQKAETYRLRDLLGPAVYNREVKALRETGLYMDLPEWGYHVFEVLEK